MKSRRIRKDLQAYARAAAGTRDDLDPELMEASLEHLADEPPNTLGPVPDYVFRFTRRSNVCRGETVLRGTRVTLRSVLASLAEGATAKEILADFSTLKEEDVQAVIAFAQDERRHETRVRSTHYSTAIEGNRLTLAEVRKVVGPFRYAHLKRRKRALNRS